MADAEMVDKLCGAGAQRGDLVGLAYAPGVGLGMATASGAFSWSSGAEHASVVVGLVEDALRPRWVWWSNETAVALIGAGVRVATCWDIAAVHRVLFGGWQADPARAWAQLHHLALEYGHRQEPGPIAALSAAVLPDLAGVKARVDFVVGVGH